MTANFPSISLVRARLALMTHAEVQSLSKASGVPFTTLWKIRTGETTNPGIETVRQFYEHITAATDPADPQSTDDACQPVLVLDQRRG